jgi:cell division protein FtsQ
MIRKKNNPAKIKLKLLVLGTKAMLVLLAFALTGTGLYFFGKSDLFELKRVEISGNKHLSDTDLMDLMRLTGEENLVMLSTERLYDRLHSSAWIKSVSMRKEFPNTLVVRLRESEPQAILRKKGGFVIVDEDGIELERLTGRLERFLPVIDANEAEDTREFREALKLASVINNIGIAKRARRVDIVGIEGDTKDLAVRIDGMEIKVGEGSYEEKLAKLSDLIEEIRSRPIDVEYIDLRFANRVIVKPVAEVVQ